MKYNPEELKKYTKDQLINVIMSISDTFNMHQEYWNKQKKESEEREKIFRQKLANAHDEGYHRFLGGNKEYLERFITEFIKEKVSVELEESDYNWFNAQVYIGGERGQSSSSIHIGEYE